MIAYILKEGSELNEEYLYTAYMGFDQRGIRVIFVESYEQVPAPKLTFEPSNNPVFVADIKSTLAYWDKCGIKRPEFLHIPEVLLPYCLREVKYMTLGEAKELAPIPTFIKSIELKLFPSGVITRKGSYNELFPYPDDTKVLISSTLDIVSEYRVFVSQGKILGMKHYTGDFFVFPDVETVQNMVRDFVGAPKAFTCDVGVTSDGKTVLVECQDAWAIGSYGLDPISYTRFLIDRWLQIIYAK